VVLPLLSTKFTGDVGTANRHNIFKFERNRTRQAMQWRRYKVIWDQIQQLIQNAAVALKVERKLFKFGLFIPFNMFKIEKTRQR
jgi:hypothetical protein